ncbi:hypothetical protein L6164_029998 [Bauhinia variegata]|uniref:Uncharacterized protein n=1 Tax=Bauhinia variegata TaxID=167791 RepID=A0ACB9LAE1_BAUVA|nr:hypothetical protein L6164_029998 [Bauhinia variegata]
MASARICLTLAILTVAGTLMFNNNNNLVSAQCGANIPALISQCSQFVQMGGPQIPPSQACCAVVQPINVPCACKLVTKDVEKYVDPIKAVFVARHCGLTIKPGMRCGCKIFLFLHLLNIA